MPHFRGGATLLCPWLAPTPSAAPWPCLSSLVYSSHLDQPVIAADGVGAVADGRDLVVHAIGSIVCRTQVVARRRVKDTGLVALPHVR